MGRYVVMGASRGIGGAVTEHLVGRGDEVLACSRTPARAGAWVPADVATDEGLDAIAQAVGAQPLDGLLFLGGIWEEGGFTDAYAFERSPREETRALIAVNLTAPILLAQALLPALRQVDNPRIVLMGSLSGLPNLATQEVANTATKFGLQGVAQALGVALRPDGIGVTVLNPANVATPEVQADIEAGRFGAQVPIALADVIATVDYVLGVERSCVPFEINLAQQYPG